MSTSLRVTGERPVVIEVDGVSKSFVIRKDKSLKEQLVNASRSRQHREEFQALNGIDLSIQAGETIGLIGPNGSGKSTLLKVIGGILRPNEGTLRRRGRIAALLELGAGFHPDLTGRENVYLNGSILGLSRRQVDEYFDAIVAFSGIENFIDTQVKFYSSGMYVRLAFAVAVHVDPDILLVDEVLAVGDEPFQRKCMDRIRAFQREGRTIVLVTHALDQVIDVCDRAVVLEHGNLVFDGKPREAARRLRQDFEEIRQADKEAEKVHASEHTTPAVTVDAVELLTASGMAVRQLQRGDSLRAVVTVTSADPLTNWIVGIGVDAMGGQAIWGTHTQMLGEQLPDLPPGTHRIEFALDDLYLGQGDYSVHGAVAHWGGGEIHRLPEAVHFHVPGDDTMVGLLGIRATLTSTA